MHGGFGGDGQPSDGPAWRSPDHQIGDADGHLLDVIPAHAASRRVARWDGIGVEIIRCITHDKVEFRFRAPCHLLLVYQEGVRNDGETLVDGFPRSTLQTLRRKLTFVPAGHEYREWQRPSVRTRLICFYLDPAKTRSDGYPGPTAAPLPSRVFFEDDALWETAAKLATAIEDPKAERYSEALAVVVAHELLRSHANVRQHRPPARGGLAAWQQRIVATYIEKHLAEPISLATLAKLVHLSSYYFCRAFKQSFHTPPHRYHINRRVERAKMLLAIPSRSVTEIASAVGFSETSSFSAAFRHATGTTPTEYRRTLE
jgi:AraC family transcriptional regulator